jgi:hypothetical protein
MRTPFAAVFSLILALAAVFASAPAQAHGRVSVGVGFGFGYPYWGPWGPWGPWYYPPAYYPVPVPVPAQPVTYIEQRAVEQRSSPAPERGAWWYYCDSSKGYYPHVKECPTGWQRVPPVLPPAK